MANKELFDELHKLFLEINKMRTDVMKKENPNDTYSYFPNDEEPELVIRKGMTQYEDLIKRFKRMEKKGGLKLSKEPEIQPPNIKTTKPKKEESEQIEEKSKQSPKKRKVSGTKEEEEESKKIPKKRKVSGAEEIKESPKKRKVSGSGTDEIKNAPKKRKVSGAEEIKESPKKRKISGTKEDETKSKPQIIKRTVGTDNPIVKNVKEKEEEKIEEKEEEKEGEKEKEKEEKKEKTGKRPKIEKTPEAQKAQEIPEKKEEEEPKEEEIDNTCEKDFVKQPEEGYTNSQIESTEFEISPTIKITAKWYYIDKKKSNDEEEDESDREEKVHIQLSTNSKDSLILH